MSYLQNFMVEVIEALELIKKDIHTGRAIPRVQIMREVKKYIQEKYHFNSPNAGECVLMMKIAVNDMSDVPMVVEMLCHSFDIVMLMATEMIGSEPNQSTLVQLCQELSVEG